MQMRPIPALILFLGSYFPLSLILLIQDIKESSWNAPLCRLSAEYSCFLPELTNPWRAVGLLFICAVSLVAFMVMMKRLSDFTVFDTFIGRNATHLRRMAVIKARGYYQNPQYMARLREINDLRNWGIQFDERGRIVATPETMSDILHVLLDHRLRSELYDNEYDVPSTTLVGQ